MKINGPGSTQGVSGSRRKSAAAGGRAFAVTGAGEAKAAAAAGPLSSASPIGSVEAVLALQAAGDATHSRHQATERAYSLLDLLDDLKLALLDGVIPRDTLERLTATLRSERETTNDPALEAALDEVELRAAVELAKHG